jgi:histidinol-phosphatase (PHP family)
MESGISPVRGEWVTRKIWHFGFHGIAAILKGTAAMPPDYHMHTPLCNHATGHPADYVREAMRKGLPEIGFADHNPMPDAFDDWRMRIEQLPRYFEMIEEARAETPEYPIRLGLECDYIPGREGWITELAGMAEWDYFIGSVHYVSPGWAVDNPAYVGRYEETPPEELWTMYWTALERCVRSRLFDFIAHPDLVKIFGARPAGDLTRFYRPVVEALAECGVAFEINTAGLRKPVHEIYPALDFLKLAREAGVGLLINSDAHMPSQVGMDFAAGVALAREAGYTTTLRLEKRRGSEVKLG